MVEVNGKVYHIVPKRITNTGVDLDIYSSEGMRLGDTKRTDLLGFSELEDDIIEEEAKKIEVAIRFAESYGVSLSQIMTLPFKASEIIDKVARKCDIDYEFVCDYISSFQCYEKATFYKAS